MQTKRGILFLALELAAFAALAAGILSLEDIVSMSAAPVPAPIASLRPSTQTCWECDRRTREFGASHLQRIWAESRGRRKSLCGALDAMKAEQPFEPHDDWGNPYEVRCEHGVLSLTSRGDDNLLGSTDDITFRMDESVPPAASMFFPPVSVSPPSR
jgi:hypothetical protein